VTVPYSASADAMKVGVGRKSGGSSTSIPNASASALLSSSRSVLSWSFHSDTSLLVSSSTAGTVFPTSVEVRKSSTARLHLWSAKSSWAFCNGWAGWASGSRTRTAASGQRTAWTGQGRRRVDRVQRGQDRGGGERTARSGDRTRAAANGQRAAGTGQGRRRADSAQRGGEGLWERKCDSSIKELRKQVVA